MNRAERRDRRYVHTPLTDTIDVDGQGARLERSWRGRADHRTLRRIGCRHMSDAQLWAWLGYLWTGLGNTAYVAVLSSANFVKIVLLARIAHQLTIRGSAAQTADHRQVDVLAPTVAYERAHAVLTAAPPRSPVPAYLVLNNDSTTAGAEA